MNIEEKKKNRFLFLQKVYDECHGSESYFTNMWTIGEQLKFDRDATHSIYDYLSGEGLIQSFALGGGIKLTHYGIKEIEQAIENPGKPTEHFLPINIINVHTMSNSVIQQGASHATQTVAITSNNLEELKIFLSEVKTSLHELKLSQEKSAELLAEIATVSAQANSPKPKHLIVRESLQTMRSILEGVAGNLITPVFQEKIALLLTYFN